MLEKIKSVLNYFKDVHEEQKKYLQSTNVIVNSLRSTKSGVFFNLVLKFIRKL